MSTTISRFTCWMPTLISTGRLRQPCRTGASESAACSRAAEGVTGHLLSGASAGCGRRCVFADRSGLLVEPVAPVSPRGSRGCGGGAVGDGARLGRVRRSAARVETGSASRLGPSFASQERSGGRGHGPAISARVGLIGAAVTARVLVLIYKAESIPGLSARGRSILPAERVIAGSVRDPPDASRAAGSRSAVVNAPHLPHRRAHVPASRGAPGRAESRPRRGCRRAGLAPQDRGRRSRLAAARRHVLIETSRPQRRDSKHPDCFDLGHGRVSRSTTSTPRSDDQRPLGECREVAHPAIYSTSLASCTLAVLTPQRTARPDGAPPGAVRPRAGAGLSRGWPSPRRSRRG